MNIQKIGDTFEKSPNAWRGHTLSTCCLSLSRQSSSSSHPFPEAPLAPFSPLSLVSVPSLHTSRQPGELDAWRSEVPGEAQPPVDLFVGLAAGPVVIGLEPTGIPVELRRTWRPTLLHLPPPAACLLALYNLLVGKPGPGTGRHCVMAGAAQSLRGLP
ncbi:hypothetical protein EJB05_12703, partial [Eragrostis curvula]